MMSQPGSLAVDINERMATKSAAGASRRKPPDSF